MPKKYPNGKQNIGIKKVENKNNQGLCRMNVKEKNLLVCGVSGNDEGRAAYLIYRKRLNPKKRYGNGTKSSLAFGGFDTKNVQKPKFAHVSKLKEFYCTDSTGVFTGNDGSPFQQSSPKKKANFVYEHPKYRRVNVTKSFFSNSLEGINAFASHNDQDEKDRFNNHPERENVANYEYKPPKYRRVRASWYSP